MNARTLTYSLAIPCFNEAQTLPSLVERCRQTLRGTGVEVVLVDNGSTDDSPDTLARLTSGDPLFKTVRVEKNEGYGFGILSGLKAASGDVIGWTHADMQTDPGDFLKAAALFERSSAPERLFVKGRRRGRPLGDEAFSVGMALFETVLLGRPLIDINAQPTVFHRRFYESWRSPPHDFSLDLYAYYSAKSRNCSVERFEVEFRERAHGASRWNVDWNAKKRFIRRTILYSFELKRRLDSLHSPAGNEERAA